MRKPIATAIFNGGYGTVSISRSRAARAGAEGVTFYAPGWRPMVFRCIDAARAKLERHPNFTAWLDAPQANQVASATAPAYLSEDAFRVA